MHLFRSAEPKQIIVREYGRASFLGLLSPLLALVTVGILGSDRRAAAIERAMEKDAALMFARGYRIASSREYSLPRFGVGYLKVTYELVDPQKAAAAGRAT